jgi:hypothetical protein
MPKRRFPTPIAGRVDVLDVRLLDLFAQVEAMLRSAREIQRNAIKLRGTSMPVSRAQQRAIVTRIRKSVATIDRESRTLRTVIRLVVQATADLQSAVRAGSPSRPRSVDAFRLSAASGTRGGEARAR